MRRSMRYNRTSAPVDMSGMADTSSEGLGCLTPQGTEGGARTPTQLWAEPGLQGPNARQRSVL